MFIHNQSSQQLTKLKLTSETRGDQAKQILQLINVATEIKFGHFWPLDGSLIVSKSFSRMQWYRYPSTHEGFIALKFHDSEDKRHVKWGKKSIYAPSTIFMWMAKSNMSKCSIFIHFFFSIFELILPHLASRQKKNAPQQVIENVC